MDFLEAGQEDLLVFEGASSGILDQNDVDATAEVIQPDSGAESNRQRYLARG